nr:unnamed protein product [Spirometra erinaceieuropaei]
MVDFDADLLASEFTRDLRRETKFTYDTVAYICLTSGVLLLLLAVFGFLSERSDNRWFSDGVGIMALHLPHSLPPLTLLVLIAVHRIDGRMLALEQRGTNLNGPSGRAAYDLSHTQPPPCLNFFTEEDTSPETRLPQLWDASAPAPINVRTFEFSPSS